VIAAAYRAPGRRVWALDDVGAALLVADRDGWVLYLGGDVRLPVDREGARQALGLAARRVR
jgi:hypothetical protein